MSNIILKSFRSGPFSRFQDFPYRIQSAGIRFPVPAPVPFPEPGFLFGVQRAVHDELSLSVRLGQYGSAGALRDDGQPPLSLSLGASTSMAGYGLGLRLIDGGGQLFGGDRDMRLMGSISRPLK